MPGYRVVSAGLVRLALVLAVGVSALVLSAVPVLSSVHAAMPAPSARRISSAPLGIEPFVDHRNPPLYRALDAAEQARAELGQEVLNTQWVPAGTPHAGRRDGVGPLFNSDSCDECHNDGAHGRGPTGDGPAPFTLVVELETPPPGPHGEPRCDPVYGCVFNTVALKGVRPEGQVVIRYRTIDGRYADGRPWSLRAPTYRLVNLAYGPLSPRTIIEPRLAPALFGDGLLEAVPASAVTAGPRASAGGHNGVGGRSGPAGSLDAQPFLGRPAWLWRRGTWRLGRFDLQDTAVSIREQTARAFAREMGLTSSVVGADDCTAAERACRSQPNGGTPEVSDALFDAVVDYVSWLAVPKSPWKRTADEQTGRRLFAEIGCAACHSPRLPVEVRGADGRLIRGTIAPYTDLRLHDLGMGLADETVAGVKVVSRWRTAPLWGLGYRLRRESYPTFLHDGRARSLAEAILWHGGEASAARRRFEHLSAAQRQALLDWLRTL